MTCVRLQLSFLRSLLGLASVVATRAVTEAQPALVVQLERAVPVQPEAPRAAGAPGRLVASAGPAA